MTIRREQLVNNAVTTLSAGINASTVSIPVVDGSVFPATGDFRILIDNELMLCTSRAGNTLTVTRPVEIVTGGTSATHDVGKAVTHVTSVRGLQLSVREQVPGYQLNSKGTLYKLNDKDDNVLTKSAWTENNVVGEVVETDVLDGSIKFVVDNWGNDIRLYHRPNLATPYQVTCCFHGILHGNNTDFTATGLGLGFGNNTNDDYQWVGYRWVGTTVGATAFAQPQLVVWNWNNVLTASTVYYKQPVTIPIEMWFRIEDDGTDLHWYNSHNGLLWNKLFTQDRNLNFTASGPDRVCLIFRNESGTGGIDQIFHLLHYKEDTL